MPKYTINYVLQGSIEAEMPYKPKITLDWGIYDLENYPHLKEWANGILENTTKEQLMSGITEFTPSLHDIDMHHEDKTKTSVNFTVVDPDHDWL